LKYPGSYLEFSSERRRPLHPEAARPGSLSVLLFPRFLAAALARQSFFYALPLAGLQIERVTFYFLDYVLGLYLPLKAAKSVLEGLTLLKSNFSQSDYTPLLVLTGPLSYGKPCRLSQVELCINFRLFRPTREFCRQLGTLAHCSIPEYVYRAGSPMAPRRARLMRLLKAHSHRQLQPPGSIGAIQLHEACRLLIICRIVSPIRVLTILNKLSGRVIKAKI